MSKTTSKKEYDDKLREDAEINKILSANLLRLRNESKTPGGKGMPFSLLAKLTALSRASIWNFENGKTGMTVATLVRLREAYGCTWDDLLGGCESNIVKERKKFTGEIVRGK